jgi:SsrA-binding protein
MTTYVHNKKVNFDYEIIEKFEAGIKLTGFEVKSIKKNQGSLEGSYIIVRGGEAFIVNMFIPPYQENNTPKGYESRSNRKLLLTKPEIKRLSETENAGLTVVPISLYNKNNLIKLSLAIVKGKKKYDKRESIKKREDDRRVKREFVDR